MIKYLIIGLLFVSCNSINSGHPQPTHEDTMLIWRTTMTRYGDSAKKYSDICGTQQYDFMLVYADIKGAQWDPNISEKQFKELKKKASDILNQCKVSLSLSNSYIDSSDKYYNLMYPKK